MSKVKLKFAIVPYEFSRCKTASATISVSYEYEVETFRLEHFGQNGRALMQILFRLNQESLRMSDGISKRLIV